MKKVIDVSTTVREGIRKTFKVSEPAIWYALTYDEKRGQSDKAKRIRQYAKMNGGVEVMVAEKNDTLLYDCDGYLRQYFPNKAVIEVDKKSGNATLFWNGSPMVSFDNIKVTELETLQGIAERWTPSDAGKMSEPTYKERFKRGVLLCWNRYNIAKHEEIKNG